MTSTNLQFAMLSVGIFGSGLLAGLGAVAAGQASAAYTTSDNATDEGTKKSADALYIGYTIGSITLFASMITFIVLLSLSYYKKP